VLVGQIGPLEGPMTVPLIMGRRWVAGSPIGGIREIAGAAELLCPSVIDMGSLRERETA
jgi:hypothetical protein